MKKLYVKLQLFLAIFFIGLLLSSCLSVMNNNTEQELETTRIIIDGTKRIYHTYVPGSVKPMRPVPLVIFFHGSRGSGMQFSSMIGFNNIAEEKKYIAVYPNSQGDIGNWAEGCNCNIADRLKVKDIEFTEKIINNVSERYSIDLKQIYAIGFSQGGLFADRLACEASDLFAGIVVVAANMSEPLSKTCNPESSTRIKIIQGTADQVLPYEGSQNGSLSLLSAKETAKFWAEKNSINSAPVISFIPDEQNKRVEVITYRDNQNNRFANVTLHSLIGVGHRWPRFSWYDVRQEIVNFIESQK